MTRRERLFRTLRGKSVDRPAVCFYELNGLDEDSNNPDDFNIYNDPSWKPLIDLTREKTDRIVMRSMCFVNSVPDPLESLTITENWQNDRGSFYIRTSIRAGDRTLTCLTRRDRNVNTAWTLEHLLKDEADFHAWLNLPEVTFSGQPDTKAVLEAEKMLGQTGIVLIDTSDPLAHVASLFEMGNYTIIAMTETDLMHQALQKVFRQLLPCIEAFARALPGRLWRIYGAEYASSPYLPPYLFEQYVCQYVTPMIEAIHRHGGFVRIHSHGRLRDILDHIVATGCDGLDPIEPPPQGDVDLAYVRQNYGHQLLLFGNLEISDIENMPMEKFTTKVKQALHEGTEGDGRGFVLMPSACPYGRKLSELTLRNYEIIVKMAEAY